ncbi:Two-component response regulator ARR1 [Acorus calamus]|uniref:Two-component response regulator ARR1 n=1 Tax=Acorus calamus TaxID=4465 RepID=A0AAV9DBU9_ACOCL|nr:Two-component response regulator ARR1 [Acorus calamus]
MEAIVASNQGGSRFKSVFPTGLRVMVVDDDSTCLLVIERMLRLSGYEVTSCNHPGMALKIIEDKREEFDLVVTDVHMPGMDGFELMQKIGLIMDIPIIMMSSDSSHDMIMKGLQNGACFYLLKPLREEELKNIWQYALKRNINGRQPWRRISGNMTNNDSSNEGVVAKRKNSVEEEDEEEDDCESSANEGNSVQSLRRRRCEDEDEDVFGDNDDTARSKKPRVVWNRELHMQFLRAIGQLGYDKAVPKKILDLMNVPNLTRENVASHLQKYRKFLKKLSQPKQPSTTMTKNRISTTGRSTYKPIFGSISSTLLSNFHDSARLTPPPPPFPPKLDLPKPTPHYAAGGGAATINAGDLIFPNFAECEMIGVEDYFPSLVDLQNGGGGSLVDVVKGASSGFGVDDDGDPIPRNFTDSDLDELLFKVVYILR